MPSNRKLTGWTRREWLAAATAAGLHGTARADAAAPAVALARCPAYGSDVLPTMRRMFDDLGGISELVSGKVVAVKIDMRAPLEGRTGHRPAWFTRWSHPDVIAAAVRLFGEAGASRIRVVESSIEDDNPLEDNIILGGADPEQILKAAPNVEMENTSYLGAGSVYHRIDVPGGGLIYPGFDVNHSYVECDVFVSIAKMKEDLRAGVGLSMENLIGITPVTIYGAAAGYEDPSVRPYGERTMFATGYRQPAPPSPPENDPDSPREPGYRIPRIIADLAGARPVHLAIIDGIETQTTSCGAWPEPDMKRMIHLVKPGILAAGLNPVSTDAVAAAAMGFDPMAKRGTAPFENCDSFLRLAEEAGLGARELDAIHVLGTPVAEAQFPFREYS